MVGSNSDVTLSSNDWHPLQTDKKHGVAIYNFQSITIKYALSLQIGETVQVLEELGEWYKGCILKDQARRGVFPKMCVVLKESTSEPLVEEVGHVLREWGAIWRRMFLDLSDVRKKEKFRELKTAIYDLMSWRSDLVMGQYTQEQQAEVVERITSTIDIMNYRLNLDMVPRVDGEIVGADDISVVELYNVHVTCSDKIVTSRKKSEPNKRSANPSIRDTRTFRRHSITIKRNSIMGAASTAKGPTTSHLLLSYKSFICEVTDPTELYFGIYDSSKACYISENFIVLLDKSGTLSDLSLLGQAFALYTNLTSSDLCKQTLYLVCKIYRRGRLLVDTKKKERLQHEFRRPFAGAAVAISDVLTSDQDDEKEFPMPIMEVSQESDFGIIEDFITGNSTGRHTPHGSNGVIDVRLKMLYGSPDKVLAEKPTCAITRRLGFPEVILPGYVRNDFYVTVYKAEFEKGSKSTAKNVEVVMSAVSSKGQIFSDCIYVGCGAEAVSEYRSYIFYHCNSPCWNETIRVSLPLEQFHQAHLRFTFNHCTRSEGFKKGSKERTFGFSFLKLLQDDSTVIKNMGYDLYVYKLDNNVKFRSVETYLNSPSHQFELATLGKNETPVKIGPSRSSKESLTIKTFLCSTKLTQNFAIVNLLRWRKKSDDEVLDSLGKLPSVPPEEVVKFIQDVFDALFNILSERDDDFSLPVFKALVSITRVVEDVRYENFKSTLNSYAEEHFSAALVYKSLINSLCLVIDESIEAEMMVTLKSTMQSLTYIFKIIIRSYVLHSSSSTNPEELSDIQELLRSLFRSMANMMTLDQENLIQPKIDMLKKLPYICQDVSIVLSFTELSRHLENIFKALPRQGHVHSAFVQVCKLKSFRAVVESELFADPGGRCILLPAILDFLGYQMEKRQELPSCLDLLADIITVMQGLPHEEVINDISDISNCLLASLIKVLLTVERKGHTIGICVSCLLGLLKLMGQRHYQAFIGSFEEISELKEFMMKLTLSFKELLTMDIFPKDWFVLKTVQNNVILNAALYFSKAFIDHFLDEHFEPKLWNDYFQLSVLFLTQPALKLESFTCFKREALLTRYGDMRLIMGYEVLSMWEVLGEKKKHFIPDLIKPILEMTLVPEPDLRIYTIPLFYDMMKVEFAETHNFKKVENELIEKLVDLIDNKNVGDEEYEKLFHRIMMEKFDQCPDPKLHEEGKKLITSITELLKRLLDNRAASQMNVNKKQKMMCIVRLIEYYQELKRDDMYLKCISNLVELHISCNDYTEAAFTLQMHASHLNWSEKKLPSFLNYPVQMEWERKEQLYLQIIDYFDRGKTWENAIQLCKELAEQYENVYIDYTKLSEILKKQAYFYDSIMKETRPPPTYFRVCFYGNGFPHYIKNEVYIFRGQELETLAGFTSRIKSDFPDAEILYKNAPPDASILNGNGQHLQLCAVTPIASETKLLQMKSVDDKIVNYFKSNGVSEFVYSRPYHKGTKDPNNEFKTLWLERTVHWSKRKFPDILKWSTIKSTRKTELTPIENAIESISQKNSETDSLIQEYVENTTLNMNRLSMVLNGTIDANVNGGIANYQSAFLSTEYILNNPDNNDFVMELKSLLSEQASILTKGLDVHQKLITAQVMDSLQPFHDKMLMQFSAMKISIETGEPLENILARPRPDDLFLSSTVPARKSSYSPRVTTPGKSSPKGSPPPGVRTPNLSKSNSDVQELLKKENKVSSKGIISNIFRRSSIPTTEPIISECDSPRKGHPSPISIARKSSTPDRMNHESQDIPADLSFAAQKRLGILKPGLTNSAPILGHIEEEASPVVPPKSNTTSISSSCGDIGHTKRSSTGNDLFSTPTKDNTEPLHPERNTVPNIRTLQDKFLDDGNLNRTHGAASVSYSDMKIDQVNIPHEEEDYVGIREVDYVGIKMEGSPPIPKARCPSFVSEPDSEAVKPELPSRKLKPQNSLSLPIDSVVVSDEDIPPPLPKKMGRTSSNASTGGSVT